jgi:hypothetical protein
MAIETARVHVPGDGDGIVSRVFQISPAGRSWEHSAMLGSMLRLTLPWRAWPTAIGACNRLETCFPRWRTCTGPATSWWRSLWRHGCGWKISRANTGHSYLDLLALRMRACTSRTRVYTSICCAPPAPAPRRRSWSRRILSTSSAVGPSAWVPPGADETPGWFLIHGDLGPTTRSRRCWTCPGWSSRFDAPPAWSSGRPPTGHGSRYVRRQQSGRRWHGSRTRHKHRYRIATNWQGCRLGLISPRIRRSMPRLQIVI